MASLLELYPRRTIMNVAWKIMRRDGVSRKVAMKKAWRWAKEKAGLLPGGVDGRPCSAARNVRCECRVCVERRKPVSERDRSMCFQPSPCICHACAAERQRDVLRHDGNKWTG